MGSDQAYLLDIIQAARLAVDYVKDVSREEFLLRCPFAGLSYPPH